MRLSDVWFTALSENESGQMITVYGRDELNEFTESGKFKERVEITWKYQANRRLSAMRQVMHPVTLSLRVKARSRRTVPAAAQGNVTDNDYVMLPVNVQARG